jgi:hypothetical protein
MSTGTIFRSTEEVFDATDSNATGLEEDKTPEASKSTDANETPDGPDGGEKKPREAEPKGAAEGEDTVEKVVEEIQRLQKLECKSCLDTINHRIAIGAALVTLKKKTEHGDWVKRLSELGFDERTAQSLMRLSKSALAGQIRGTAPVLAKWLPTDLTKLDTLGKLSDEQLQKALIEWGRRIKTMSRKQLRDEVNSLLNPEAKGSPATETPKATTDDEVGEPSGHLDNLLATCAKIDDPLKDAMLAEISAGEIDKTAVDDGIKKLKSTIARLDEIIKSLYGASNERE